MAMRGADWRAVHCVPLDDGGATWPSARDMHETDFLHEHVMTEDERAALAHAIWSQENVEFKTVGIDIGSSTSHLLFAKVALQRQAQGLQYSRAVSASCRTFKR